jgi:DNA-binding transcriptional ArsR family regulator
MGRFNARVQRLPSREEAQRRQAAATLAARVDELLSDIGDELASGTRQSLQIAKRALRREARDNETPSDWPGGYDMLSRRQMEYVRKELRKLGPNDRRQDVYDAFLLLIGNIERDTGEILLSRKEFANELGILPRHVSSVMTTLERMGVVRRERDGRGVTYFVDANVAWNGDLHLRKLEAAKSVKPSNREEAPTEPAGPLLILMQGGLAEEPGQAPGAASAPPGASGLPVRPRKRRAVPVAPADV